MHIFGPSTRAHMKCESANLGYVGKNVSNNAKHQKNYY